MRPLRTKRSRYFCDSEVKLGCIEIKKDSEFRSTECLTGISLTIQEGDVSFHISFKRKKRIKGKVSDKNEQSKRKYEDLNFKNLKSW